MSRFFWNMSFLDYILSLSDRLIAFPSTSEIRLDEKMVEVLHSSVLEKYKSSCASIR